MLLCGSLFFVAVWLRDPTWWMDTSVHDEKWFDVMIMLDVSKSMNVMDMSGEWRASRLDTAKKMLWDMVVWSPENRYGLWVFAWESLWIAPLTTDTNLFLTFLGWVDSWNLTEQWTDLLEAVEFGSARFGGADSSDQEEQVDVWGRVLIVVSDGWDEKLTLPRKMKESLDEMWIYLVTLWVWTRQWGPIPDWRDMFWNMSFKQQNGKTVMSSFNERWLRWLAEAWWGSYIWVDSLTDIRSTLRQVNWLEQKIISKKNEKEQHIGRWFIWVWLVMFVFFLWSVLTKNFSSIPTQ